MAELQSEVARLTGLVDSAEANKQEALIELKDRYLCELAKVEKKKSAEITDLEKKVEDAEDRGYKEGEATYILQCEAAKDIFLKYGWKAVVEQLDHGAETEVFLNPPPHFIPSYMAEYANAIQQKFLQVEEEEEASEPNNARSSPMIPLFSQLGWSHWSHMLIVWRVLIQLICYSGSVIPLNAYLVEMVGLQPAKRLVASFGAALMDYNILTMSVAPRDKHEAQVQFALERGLPAMLGILSIHRLPYPSRSFDMAHCSRCIIPWTAYDGLFLLEIDCVLPPGGYWVLSGPPINWRVKYKGWERTPQDLENEQKSLEDLARRLCWKKIRETGLIAVWQKPTNHVHCAQKLKTWKAPKFCAEDDADAGWYKKMDTCITPLPKVADVHDVSGGALEKWPKRLNIAPPRIRNAVAVGMTVKAFNEDNQLWKRRVSYYGSVLKPLFAGQYRNIMDMNAGIGGFAAALVNYPVWVMTVVPTDAKNNTLGIIYERGLIGTYMNW
ncbi:probable methyltransferase PMT19 [Camellia sinensis]|uniref:probable methyltransferase PMT19 n=1 Tax=Camellia sinensis TaxID=4442 RepID=UPI0010362AA9|nr:probable methyltransferase PMT19 [Camellia sinensis]